MYHTSDHVGNVPTRKDMNEHKSLTKSDYWHKESAGEIINAYDSVDTTEEFSNSMDTDMEDFQNMVKKLVAKSFDEQMSEKAQVIIDLALDAYELRKQREVKKSEYKLVKKNTNKK